MSRAKRSPVVASDRDLMRAQVATLFTHDARGRMLRVNEPGGKEAPRFFLGRTSAGNEFRVRHDVDDLLRRELIALTDAEPATDASQWRRDASPYATVLGRFAPVERVWAGPAYCFPKDLARESSAVCITTANSELLRPHLEEWLGDVGMRDPMFAMLSGGRAVAICCSVRTSALADEAGVETAAEFRGRGFGSRAVAAWAAAVRARGRVPLYSTSWDNLASQAVARSLGLRLYGADLHIS